MWSILRRGLPPLVALGLAACPGGGPSPDAGPGRDAAATTDAGRAAPPVALTPCPAGWAERWDEEDGVTWCDPWPEGGQQTCGPDEAHFAGETGCTRVGPACPAGAFPAELPSDATVIFAEPGALGGDGTEGAPFGTVAEAMAVATPGAVVALAKGVFDEATTLPAGVTLQGACAGETHLGATVVGTRAVVLVTGADAAIRDLRVVGDDAMTGLRVVPPGSLTVEGVIVEGVDAALVAVDAVLRARDVATRSTGAILVTVGEANVELSRVAVGPDERTTGMLLTFGMASVRVSNTVIRGHNWAAVNLDLTALEVRDSVLYDLRPGGIFLVGSGSLELDRVLIEDTSSSTTSGRDGNAVAVQGGGSVHVSRSVIQRSRDAALLAVQAGTQLEVSDVVIRDSEPELCQDTTCPGAGGGSGIVVAESATASANRFLITRAHACGVQLATGASLDLAVGVVAESSIGACVQVDGFDVTRLSDRVAYRDNGTNLDSVDLPVPTIDSSVPTP